MFGNFGDKLSAALEAYQRDYASRIKKPANMDAQKAAALVKEAKDIVGKSGLGPALAPTLVEHVKYWPSWSKRDDFQKRIGFPASDILASEDQNGKKDKAVGVLFTYKGQRYGIRLTDHGFTSLPDGDVYNGGKADSWQMAKQSWVWIFRGMLRRTLATGAGTISTHSKWALGASIS